MFRQTLFKTCHVVQGGAGGGDHRARASARGLVSVPLWSVGGGIVTLFKAARRENHRAHVRA